jgi:hypothetical protein
VAHSLDFGVQHQKPLTMKELPMPHVLVLVLLMMLSLNLYAEKGEADVQGVIGEPDELMQMEVMQSVLSGRETEIAETKICHKFFNKRNQLVYMCKDLDDERLKELLRRSDYLWKTHSSSYYLLGD